MDGSSASGGRRRSDPASPRAAALPRASAKSALNPTTLDAATRMDVNELIAPTLRSRSPLRTVAQPVDADPPAYPSAIRYVRNTSP
jgi:hypothetical protein